MTIMLVWSVVGVFYRKCVNVINMLTKWVKTNAYQELLIDYSNVKEQNVKIKIVLCYGHSYAS